MEYLEAVEVDQERMQDAPFRLPVQWVNRPSSDFRGYAGTVAAGQVAPGDRVVVLPRESRRPSTRVVSFDGDLELGVAGQAVTLTLADEIDVSRGDMIAAADAPAPVSQQFEATVVWMAEEPLLRGRTYLMRVGTTTVPATVAPIRYKLDVDTLEQIAATQLDLNEIGVVLRRARAAGRVRPVRRQPRHRRLHPHRPDHEPHGRRGAAHARCCRAARTSACRSSWSTALRAPGSRRSARSSSG